MALFQLVQANAFVVDLGAHRLKLGLAHDVGPTTFLPFQPVYLAEPERLAQRLYDAYRTTYAALVSEPQPVFLAVAQDARPSFLFRLADCLLSVFPGVVFHSALSCALYASGRLTCVLLDAGQRALRVVTALDGVLLDVVRESRFCGAAFECELLRLLRGGAGGTFEGALGDASELVPGTPLAELLDGVKRDFLAASLDPGRDAAISKTTELYTASFRLPCGTELVLNGEKHGLFEELYGRSELLGTVTTALETKALTSGCSGGGVPLVLSGGLSGLANFGRRLSRDLRGARAAVVGSQDAANAVWQGAAAFVGVGILQDAMITRRALDEEGAHLLARVVV
ncbi:Actin related protein [Giardia muris]|uniref:Actin related protein n=1 Tax=Giardia muris TaxID=5742 RepID=A0A4Z1SQN0_GIAMU|nr:Actin related protein [Giardia muris]|eukprot:TNJ27235.1 Actin related protein [Giardia muris]